MPENPKQNNLTLYRFGDDTRRLVIFFPLQPANGLTYDFAFPSGQSISVRASFSPDH
jgi:hypothetical protein